jgi:hypothetical protein
MKNSTLFVSAAALIVTAAASAQFTGAYAPGSWTVTGAGGAASAVFAGDGSRLTMTGHDEGFGGQQINVTHAVVGSGTWSFDWTYSSINSDGFDEAYYTINGVQTFLSSGDDFGPSFGSVSVGVVAGDVIGWRVTTVDGVFGPGVLNIENFEIPGPGALALLGLAGLARSRRRA